MQRNALKYAKESQKRIEGMTRDQVCVRYRKKVVLLARRIHERLSPDASVQVDDLASCGAIGLLEAFERFDPTRGIQFSTFAEYRIRGAIYDALRHEDTFTRRRRELAKKIERAIEACTVDGVPADASVVAKSLDISLEEYWTALDRIKPISHISIDSVSKDGEDEGRPLLEKLMDPSIPGPEAILAASEVRTQLKEAILALPERPRQCILMYYGKDLSLAEIAAVYGVTVSRVSQILSEGRVRLRKELKRRFSDDDIPVRKQ